MANEVSGYAFDIEGTLYKNGKLQAGVPALFNFLSTQNKPIMFVSGMNVTEIKSVVDKIEKESNIKLKNYKIASNAGSVIVQDDKVEKASFLSSEDIKKIRKIAQRVAPGSVMVYRTRLSNYRERAIEADTISNKIRKGVTVVLKALLQFMKKIELHTIPTSRPNLNNIMTEGCASLDIIALPKQAKALGQEIAKTFPKLAISGGASVQVSARDKLSAMKDVFGDKTKDVCYFGDSVNDIKCIMSCDKAVLANANKTKMFEVIAKEQAAGKDKYATQNLSDPAILEYISSDKYNKEKLMAITADAMMKIKDAKKVEKANVNVVKASKQSPSSMAC